MTNDTLHELIEDEAALQRWTGEGGSACDKFGVVARIQAQLERHREGRQALEQRQSEYQALATWPGWKGYDGRKAQPPKVRQDYIAFEDHTRPDERTFGFYLIRVPALGYGQLARASHPTAARIARSRTQYGESELHFLKPIDTPALD